MLLVLAVSFLTACDCQELETAVRRSHVAARDLGTPVRTANTISYKLAPGYGPQGHHLLCRVTTAESGGHFFALDLVTDKLCVHPLNHLEGYPITLGSDGMIYVGSTTGEIMRYDPKTDGWGPLAQVFTRSGIHHVRCMTEGKDGWLYVGSCYGERARCRMSDGTVEMLPAVEEPGSWYVSSCGTLPDGRVIFGLGHTCRILCYDPQQRKDVGQWAPDSWRNDGFAINTTVGRDVVYVDHFPSGRRGAFDAMTGEFLGEAPWPPMKAAARWSKWWHSSGYGSGIDYYLHPENDAILACDGKQVYQWNPKRPDLPATIPLEEFKAPPSLALQMRYSVEAEGEYLEWDSLRLSVVRQRTFPEPPVQRGLFALGVGPDGKLYGGAYQSMRLFRYDPDTQQLRDLGNHNPNWSGETYSFTVRGEELIICSYTNGSVMGYSPSKPWECTKTRQVNPRVIGFFGQLVYRPYACCVGSDGRIWGVGPAGWGTRGGGVAWVNPDTGESGATQIGEGSWGVLALPNNQLLVCGSVLRWWDCKTNAQVAQASWPFGGVSGCALLAGDPPRVLICGGKTVAICSLPSPGGIVVERQFEAPINCVDLRPWGQGRFIMGGPDGFATFDPTTTAWHHFADARLGHRWAFAVIGNTVYFHSGAHLMAVDVPDAQR